MSDPTPGALPATQRSLAPDLARGFMLLVIAVVHAYMVWTSQRMGMEGTSGPPSGPDTAVAGFVSLFAEYRGYPMFAALFGYGLTQIYLRRRADGREWPWIRRLLRRRGWWLIAFGFAHTALLFYGDILSVYGLIALLFVAVLHLTDRKLLAFAAGWLVVGSALYAVASTAFFAGIEDQTGAVEVTPLTDLVGRLVSWPFMLVLMLLVSAFPFLVGVWAARRQLLERPERHSRFLSRIAAVGIPLAVLGGIPHALIVTGVWAEPTAAVTVLMAWLNIMVGYAGGFGYAALIALVALWVGGRGGVLVGALAATGQRSMTCYLLQSVAWVVLFMPYTLDLATGMSAAGAVATGTAVWLATVVLADLMRRRGHRGPAEALLRRLTYGPRRAEGTGPGSRTPVTPATH